MANPEDIELVNDSLARCSSQSELFQRFYVRFRDHSDEIAAKFAGVDMKAQVRALRQSFLLIMRAVADDPGAWQELEIRAVRHDRHHLDIRPGLYDRWLECLVATVPEFDARFDDRTQAAWRNVLQEAIDFMTERY